MLLCETLVVSAIRLYLPFIELQKMFVGMKPARGAARGRGEQRALGADGVVSPL